MENVGAGKLSMPEQEMHTTAFWLHFPAAFLARFPDFTPAEKQSGLAGLGNALRTVAALLLMCDPRDLGVAFSEEPNLYLYDCYPGGVGQSAPLYRMAERLVRLTAELTGGVRLRGRLPFVRGRGGRSGRAGEGGGHADRAGVTHWIVKLCALVTDPLAVVIVTGPDVAPAGTVAITACVEFT